ncbi:hypothetical protein [Pseudomonas massiliensis]|uniref:hypothetical protein n=1 Tax=Pseudomonas massiliensis TaxID=522492 RepID=UPI00058C3405|nr:hypothetical protein [Pseudomonas massiliensis]
MSVKRQMLGRPAFPRELAERIAAKADAMARKFEERAIEEMVSEAKRALGRGEGEAQIIKEMGL